MADPSLTDYGVAGALVWVVLTKVFNFLKDMRATEAQAQAPAVAPAHESLDVNSLLATKENSFRILEKVNKIHEMHDKTDEDGVYVWYVKASLARSIHKLGDSVDELVKLLKEDHG